MGDECLVMNLSLANLAKIHRQSSPKRAFTVATPYELVIRITAESRSKGRLTARTQVRCIILFLQFYIMSGVWHVQKIDLGLTER